MKLKEVREQKNKYLKNSISLQKAYFNEKNSFEHNRMLKEQQNAAYKKYKFYDNLEKEMNKLGKPVDK